MYHYQVKRVDIFSTVTERTTIGLSKPCNHPMQESIRIFPTSFTGIQVGDLVRCDGLPYLTKPSKKFLINMIAVKRYTPVKISSGMWVLRETPIQSVDLKEQRK